MSDDKLAPVRKMGSFVKKVGIQGALAKAQEATKNLVPTECPNRYVIGFDDSGSMGSTPLANAKSAVMGFLQHCVPQETSVGLILFSDVDRGAYNPDAPAPKIQPLTCIYDQVNFYLAPIRATSSTPLYETMIAQLEHFPLTRAILFSDGSPDHDLNKEAAILGAIEAKVPFDTVYIGYGDSPVLKEIAERTGGIYVHFTDFSVFAKQMKYLSPKYVALLANADLKARIERGETI